jgi:hypothetical protein
MMTRSLQELEKLRADDQVSGRIGMAERLKGHVEGNTQPVIPVALGSWGGCCHNYWILLIFRVFPFKSKLLFEAFSHQERCAASSRFRIGLLQWHAAGC